LLILLLLLLLLLLLFSRFIPFLFVVIFITKQQAGQKRQQNSRVGFAHQDPIPRLQGGFHARALDLDQVDKRIANPNQARNGRHGDRNPRRR